MQALHFPLQQPVLLSLLPDRLPLLPDRLSLFSDLKALFPDRLTLLLYLPPYLPPLLDPHTLLGMECGGLRGGKLGENVWVVVLLDFESDVVIFIAVAMF